MNPHTHTCMNPHTPDMHESPNTHIIISHFGSRSFSLLHRLWTQSVSVSGTMQSKTAKDFESVKEWLDALGGGADAGLPLEAPGSENDAGLPHGCPWLGE